MPWRQQGVQPNLLAAGSVVHESVGDRLKRLDAMAIGPDDEEQTGQTQP